MIETSRLRLRPLTASDASKVFVMSQESGLRRWIPDQVYRDELHAEEVVGALAAYTANRPDPRVDPYVLGVEHVASRELIGHVGLSAARGSVEVGYAIEERRHGRGFATEAVSAMAAWALGQLGLPEVLGVVDADNRASRRVLEKAGFVRTGEEARGATTIVIYRRTANE